VNRNWYALALLFLLAVGLFSAGRFVDASICQIDVGLDQAYACANAGDFAEARQLYRKTAAQAREYSPVWILLIRRNLIDQLNQTLATIPAYAIPENQSDLAVETARARTQALQIRQSFFSWF